MTEIVPASRSVQIRETSRPLDKVKLHFVNNLDQAGELLRWLSSNDAKDVIAVDTESSGLNKQKDIVKLVQVGGREHGWAIPWDGWWGVFADIVKRYEGHFAFHNAPFDVPMLDRAGVSMPRPRVRDTRVMSHIIDSTYSTALKNQAAKHVDPRAAAAQKGLDGVLGKRGGWTWGTIPVDYQPYWSYGAVDAVLTRHLHDHHLPIVMADAPYAYEVESAVQWVISRMETYGTHIDVPYATEAMNEFDRYVDEVEKWCLRTYNVKPGSNAKIVEILVRDGVNLWKRTDSGAFALDKEVLGGIDHPLAQAVFRRRQLQKLSSTYLHHYVEECDDNDLIHPTVNVLGTRTSRMSMQDPNLQNLPRIDTTPAARRVRNSVSARPGHTMLFCDFDQIEMRLLAHMAEEPGMIAAFKGEGDFFVNLARDIFADPTIEKKDKRRQITKNAGYATIYGAGIAKFSATAGIPESEGAAFMQRWNALYPAVRRHAYQTQHEATQRFMTEGVPYVRCPITGRRQIADRGKEYALVNYKIQGAAAALFKIKILEMDAGGLGDYMVAPVHDEILLDVPNELVNDAVIALGKIMNDDQIISVPVTASVASGKRWGEKKDWEWPREITPVMRVQSERAEESTCLEIEST